MLMRSQWLKSGSFLSRFYGFEAVVSDRDRGYREVEQRPLVLFLLLALAPHASPPPHTLYGLNQQSGDAALLLTWGHVALCSSAFQILISAQHRTFFYHVCPDSSFPKCILRGFLEFTVSLFLNV